MTVGASCSMDEYQGNYAKRQKLDKKKHTLNDYISVTLEKI